MESRPLPPPSNVNEHVSRFDPRAAAQEFEHELSPGMRDEPLPGGENVKRIIGLVVGPLLAVALFPARLCIRVTSLANGSTFGACSPS